MVDRVVVLIDMDCFYCQVESRLNPSLIGKPMAVVQYNQWKGGGIIAVNYEARDRGVTRHMRGEEAKQHCPEIILVTVPTVREKADLTRYRDAGREVLRVFCQISDCVQRASIDEAFLDISSLVDERMKSFSEFDANNWKSTYVVGYSTDGSNNEDERVTGMNSWLDDCESLHNTPSLRLAVGALIVEEMRAAVLAETGFKCSAGIAHNKILAKLACGLHKPNRQTILPQESIEKLYQTLPVKKIRNLGGKFGDEIIEKLGCKTMNDLAKFTERDLRGRYDEKTGTWLYNIARGYDFEPVQPRLVSKSIGCCKKFPGKQALVKNHDVYHWLYKLAEELSERLLEDETVNKRRAQLLTVSTALEINRIDCACSKSTPLTSYNVEKIGSIAESLLKKICRIDSSGLWSPPIKNLGLSAGKFVAITTNKIDKFFKTDNYFSARPGSNPVNNNENNSKGNNGCDSKKNKNDNCSNEENNDISSKEEHNSTTAKEEEKLSFFERKLGLRDSTKKLIIVPDLSSHDPFLDNGSCSSRKKVRPENDFPFPGDSLKDSIKKNLFMSCETHESDVKSVPMISTKKETDSNSTTKKKGKSKTNEPPSKPITSFFNNPSKVESWVKPEELFPDLNEVDEEMLSFLPESYRNKILMLKKEVAPQVSEHAHIESSNGEAMCDEAGSENSCEDIFGDYPSTSRASEDCRISKPEDSASPSSVVIDNILYKCEECGESVDDLAFHMDMHLAKKLHKELNSYTTVVTKNASDSNEKKKRRKYSKKYNSDSKKIKSIDSFFIKR